VTERLRLATNVWVMDDGEWLRDGLRTSSALPSGKMMEIGLGDAGRCLVSDPTLHAAQLP
jgi:hypothetical protein